MKLDPSRKGVADSVAAVAEVAADSAAAAAAVVVASGANRVGKKVDGGLAGCNRGNDRTFSELFLESSSLRGFES
jgi:hypothetical protein